MFRRIVVVTAAAALALTGCNAAGTEPDPSATAQPHATSSATSTPTPSPSSSSFAELVDAQYPDQDWEPKDSPALNMSREDAGKYLEAATVGPSGEMRLDFTDFESVNAADTQVFVAVATDLSRLGRDLMLVTMLRDAVARGGTPLDPELEVARLEAGWGLCTAARGGADLAAEWAKAAEKSQKEFDDYLETGTSEEELQKLYEMMMAQEAGRLFAYLQCPEFADEALKAQEGFYGADE